MRRKLVEKIKQIIEEAKKANHRRLFIIYGSKKAGLAARIVQPLGKKRKVLYASHSLEIEENGVRNFKAFKKIVKKCDAIIFPETEKVLGTTYDACVIDLTHQLVPNDIGILVEVVRGGGIVIFLTPRFEEWKNIRTYFQERLVSPPYTVNDVRPRFIQRFIEKLKKAKGVCIIDSDSEKLWYNKPKETKTEEIVLSLPKQSLFSEKVYEMCKTNEQIKVVKAFERFYEKHRGKDVIIVVADRGRGKSAALGIALAALCERISKIKKFKVFVTAPQFLNVKTLFEFLQLTFNRLKIKYKVVKYEGTISKIHSDRFSIEFWNVNKLLTRKCDLLIVDEAAGIPVNVLFKLLHTSRKFVFSSTIHGYEGAGRGFSLRFLKRLREEENLRKVLIKMKTPIRYAEGDPIEAWLYNCLLLDAEPSKLDKRDVEMAIRHEVLYKKPSLDELFFTNERKLREFIGTYVLAHYRNRPNDVEIIGEAPHHHIRTLELKNEKIVCCLQIAEEGGLTENVLNEMLEGFEPSGNIIPDRLLKHYRIKEFGKLKGIRIVRIAVHPSLFGKGLGSLMLKKLESEFTEKVDWIGASFGASYELLRFWIKNGFVPLHLSPDRNPVSGEYSCIVVKPLNKKCVDVMKEVLREFMVRFLDSLQDSHKDVEPRIARLLLSYPVEKEAELNLSKAQLDRLKMYLKGPIDYEACDDSIRRVVKAFFMKRSKVELTDLQKEIIIARVLQCKTWEEVSEELDVGPKYCVVEVRKIMEKICGEML